MQNFEFTDFNLYDYPILIAKISLKYNDDSIILMEVSRKQYSRMKRDKKEKKAYFDYLIQRISATRYNELSRQINRKEAYKQYDKAIQQKYNVGENWQQNRWFVEQVRPSLF